MEKTDTRRDGRGGGGQMVPLVRQLKLLQTHTLTVFSQTGKQTDICSTEARHKLSLSLALRVCNFNYTPLSAG